MFLFLACAAEPTKPEAPSADAPHDPAPPPKPGSTPAGQAAPGKPAGDKPAATTVPSTSTGSGACPDCNVVWVTMDTTRADRMGFLGNRNGLTPNLDKLAATGSVWTRAYSQAPETTLSVGSYFSGRYRHNNGMDFYLSEKDRVHPLSEELSTVAEVFGGRGYRTAGIYANPLMWEKSNLNLHQGFDVWRAGPDEEMASIATTLWEKGQKAEGKVFLYAHFFGPHTDNPRLEGFEQRRGKQKSALGNVTEKLYTEVRTGATRLSDGDVAYVRAMYDDATWKMDEHIGALIRAVSALPGGDRTIWIFTADHGESLLEPAAPPWLGHEAHLHEEMVHVPLVIAGPGVRATRVETPVEVVDVAPTLFTLLGVAIDPAWRWDGEDLYTKGGTAMSERGVWAEREVSLRDDRNVAIKHLDGKVRCFDRATDPLQAKPLADPAPCAALVQKIDAYTASARPPTPTGTAGTDEATQEMLKALGYKE